MPDSPAQPTTVELDILRILWDLEPCPVRDIHARLHQEKGTNYSTTVKMLSIMLGKGFITRDEKVSPHIYSSVLTRQKAGKRFLVDLIEKVYEGSATSLVLQALSSRKASTEEIAAIRKLLDSMENRK
jgi:predicted transcriptional regulator